MDGATYANVFENLHDVMIVHVAASFAIATIGLMEYITMIRIAEEGDPTHPEARKCLGLVCSLDLTIFLCLRVCVTVFGWFLATVLTDYCQCSPDPDIEGSGNNVTRALLAFSKYKDFCWMYQSGWTVSYLGLIVTQSIDWVWGCLHYLSLIFHLVPTRLFISARFAWNCCCQCYVGCLNCMICFRMGGLQAIGSSDTAEFAEICPHFFGNGGIVDIAFSDILAGLYVTRLIHYSIEVSVRDHLLKEGLASLLVRKEIRREVGRIEVMHIAVKRELIKDGLVPKRMETGF